MSGSWTDVAKGKEIGISMISTNKADVISHLHQVLMQV